MKTILSSRRDRYLARFTVFLVMVALVAGMVGCGGVRYELTVSSTEGGDVDKPKQATSTHSEGEVVNLVALPKEGHRFVNWTPNVGAIANVSAAETTITMNSSYSITANFALEILEIRDWGDLHAIRDKLSATYILMNDLDYTTANYTDLASPTADGPKGWLPIGTANKKFKGTFDGQGHEIRDLFIDRTRATGVGLFGYVAKGAVIQNVRVVNANVTGRARVGALVGSNEGTVSSSNSSGNVTGDWYAGGLAGINYGGTVSNSYSTGSVNGTEDVGGLVGCNYEESYVIDSYYTGGVSGDKHVGGLVGWNQGTMSSSNSSGNVTGNKYVGGLVGYNNRRTVGSPYATLDHSYSAANVTGEQYVGGLVGCNDKESTVSNSYSTGNVTGKDGVGGLVGFSDKSIVRNSHYSYDDVLINGHNTITIGALSSEDFHRWLDNDRFLEFNERLRQENDYYVVNNVTDFKELLAFGQDSLLRFRLKNDLDLADEPNFYIPYFAAEFDGNSHKIWNLSLNFDFGYNVGLFGCLAPGGRVTRVGVENAKVTGAISVGGLVGANWEGSVSNSYSTGNVSGTEDVGGLVGRNYEESTVSNCTFTGNVTGERSSTGGLVGRNSGEVSESSSTGSVTGKGNVGGLVGYNSYGGTVTDSYSTGNVNGVEDVGGLVGFSEGDIAVVNVKSSKSTCNVTGTKWVGGLVGRNNKGTVSNCYSTGGVVGTECTGGLVGLNDRGTVNGSYAAGSVSGKEHVGGLVGQRTDATVSRSFWDTQTSGQTDSDGGTPKTTAEMKSMATFKRDGWIISTVDGPGERDDEYTWNIVEGETYPFLSWQPV